MELGADDYLIKPPRGITGGDRSSAGKQAALRQWFAVQSQSFQSHLVDTRNQQPRSRSFLPHLSKVFHFIEVNYHQPITLGNVAEVVGYSFRLPD